MSNLISQPGGSGSDSALFSSDSEVITLPFGTVAGGPMVPKNIYYCLNYKMLILQN